MPARATVRRRCLLAGSSVLVATLAACGGSSGHRATPAGTAPPTTSTATTSPTTTAATTTAAPTTAAPTTTAPTTTAVPSAPQPSGDIASADLIADWKAGDRASALHVATAGAVASLFATAYAGQTVIGRGCQEQQFPPVICSYGPEGGASSADSLYQLTVTQTTAGWYVSAVDVE